jgi:hypothetical protein
MQKSKPVMLAAGLIWALLGVVYAARGQSAALEAAAKHVLLDYGELMLFIVVAVTYANTMEERRLFDVPRIKVANSRLTYRQLFSIGLAGRLFIVSSSPNPPHRRLRRHPSRSVTIVQAAAFLVGEGFSAPAHEAVHEGR